MFTAKRSVMLFGRVFGIELIIYVEDVIDFAKKPWATTDMDSEGIVPLAALGL
jgi:hypothetical protein